MPWIYLVLIVLVLIIGFGVLLVNRYSAGRAPRETPSTGDTPEQPPPQAAAAPDVSPAPVAVIEEERPTFRSRMSKARNALAGTLLGIRSRRGITDETWEDLEEALLRADVGVRVTDDLLNGLRTRVKAKEITEPEQLLEGQVPVDDEQVQIEPAREGERRCGVQGGEVADGIEARLDPHGHVPIVHGDGRVLHALDQYVPPRRDPHAVAELPVVVRVGQHVAPHG